MHRLLLSDLFRGRQVEYRSQEGVIALFGHVGDGGLIACECPACQGRRMPWWEFEQHAGGFDTFPGDQIFLSNGSSFREILHAINTGLVALAESPQMKRFWVQCMSGQVKLSTGRSVLAIIANYLADLPENKGDPSMAFLKTQWQLQISAAANRKVRSGNKHKRLFEVHESQGGLRQGEPVRYIAHGRVLLEGHISGHGIFCYHCSQEVSCSSFEDHAGRGTRRAPYDNIHNSQGVTLKQLAMRLEMDGEVGPTVRKEAHRCGVCRQANPDGRPLVFCCACPWAFHEECVSAKADPEAEYICARCTGGGVTSATEAQLTETLAKCRYLLTELDTVAGGCVLCRCSDFTREGFGPRTILLCEQCEREYHVGCLEERGMARLTALPENEWFCDGACAHVHRTLKGLLRVGGLPVPQAPRAPHLPAPGGGGHYTCEVLCGKGATIASAQAHEHCLAILQKSFDPLTDFSTGTDLLPIMVAASTYKDQDFRNVYTLLLRRNLEPVCAAVIRVFGTTLAELPFIAVPREERRQGHCRVMMDTIESLLASMHVRQLCLPAAEDALGTWIHGFRFELMSDEELKQARTDLKVLVFPGTKMLKKAVEDDPLETPWIPTEFHLPAQRKRPLRTLQIDDEED